MTVEWLGRRDDALGLYRRIVWQYRLAEPGMAVKAEAAAAAPAARPESGQQLVYPQ